MQFPDGGGGASAGAAAGLGADQGAAADFRGARRVVEQSSHCPGQIRGAGDLHTGAGGAEFVGDGLEVFHVRTHHHRLGE